MIQRVPEELRNRAQWVCANLDKIPFNPRTKRCADVNDPTTWGTFSEAINAGFAFIGFVLSKDDPYTIIDLDCPENEQQYNLHQAILIEFDTYVEKSQSGLGYHLIVRGKIPHGFRLSRDKVEIYSSERYMICTGNVVKERPIREYQAHLDNMAAQLAPKQSINLEDVDSILSDEELLQMACNAHNADKFNALCNGDMSGYPSQSEADLALMSILAFYTKDNEQVRRLFRMSALGKREKAVINNRYLDYTLRRIRSHELPPVNLDAIMERAEALVQVEQAQPPAQPTVTPITTVPVEPPQTPVSPLTAFPPNLLGEVAQYIFESAPRPVKEIALAGAITLFAGLTGRQYNVSSTGLNMYTILLAKTGTGKEAASTGINHLLKAVRNKVPMVDQFRGPSTFASAPAIAKSLVDKPCQFVILGEFGIWLSDLCGQHIGGPNPLLRRALLDLYHKSGWSQMLMGTEYSDITKNAQAVVAPALTILGESTPDSFFDCLNENMVASGLLPRFLVIEYQGNRVGLNPSCGFEPPENLVSSMANLAARVLQTASNNTCVNVALSAQASQVSQDFEVYTTQLVNENKSSGAAEMWNRAHIKALRLAGLNAVATNPDQPVICPQGLSWAINVVLHDVNSVLSRFNSGDIGEGNAKQLAELRAIVKDYYVKKPAASYRCSEVLHKAKVITYAYLQQKTCTKASFSKTKIGATESLRLALKVLTDSGELQEIPTAIMHSKYRTQQKAYGLGDSYSSNSAS